MMVVVHCPICGTEFKPAYRRRIYCCVACYKEANREKALTNWHAREESKIKPPTVCANCSTQFDYVPRQIYCCRKCQKEARKKQSLAEYHRNKILKRQPAPAPAPIPEKPKKIDRDAEQRQLDRAIDNRFSVSCEYRHYKRNTPEFRRVAEDIMRRRAVL